MNTHRTINEQTREWKIGKNEKVGSSSFLCVQFSINIYEVQVLYPSIRSTVLVANLIADPCVFEFAVLLALRSRQPFLISLPRELPNTKISATNLRRFDFIHRSSADIKHAEHAHATRHLKHNNVYRHSVWHAALLGRYVCGCFVCAR